MNALAQGAHDNGIQELARGFRERGFDVIAAPNASQLPFELSNYCQPSLIARKGDIGVIVEVRSRRTASSPSMLFDLGEQVAEHPGWRFMSATTEDIAERDIIFELSELPGWAEINDKLAQLDTLAGQQAKEPALLYAWQICEAALRRIAMEDHLPMEQMPTLDLINNLYTFGEIPLDHFTALKTTLPTRNQLAKGKNAHVDSGQLQAFVNALKITITEYLALREEKRLRYIYKAQELA